MVWEVGKYESRRLTPTISIYLLPDLYILVFTVLIYYTFAVSEILYDNGMKIN